MNIKANYERKYRYSGKKGDDQLHQNQGVSWITFPLNTRNPKIIYKISVKQHLITVIITRLPLPYYCVDLLVWPLGPSPPPHAHMMRLRQKARVSPRRYGPPGLLP